MKNFNTILHQKNEKRTNDCHVKIGRRRGLRESVEKEKNCFLTTLRGKVELQLLLKRIQNPIV